MRKTNNEETFNSVDCKPSLHLLRNTTALSRRRQRGSMLLDAALATGILFSLVAYSIQSSEEEMTRQKRTMVSSEHDVMLASARSFVKSNYHDMIMDLYDADGVRTYTASDLVGAGFLPASYSGGLIKSLYDQDYAIIARAVDRADGAVPQSTMTRAVMDPLTTGAPQASLLDGDPSNGEMEIESLLVTYGGDAMSGGDMGAVIGQIEGAYGGVVTDADVATGAYANFELDISGFSGLAEYPDEGHMASVLSLSSYGVLGTTGGDSSVIDPFRRCMDMNIATNAYSDCIASNEIYSDIVLRPYDSDGNGSIDQFPVLRNVTMLDCAEGTNTGVATEFTIDCGTTRMSGNLIVEGDDAQIGALDVAADGLDFGGDDLLTRKTISGVDENVLSTDRIMLTGLNGGQDMSEVISNSEVVAARATIDKPVCTATTEDGLNTMSPRAYVSPAAYSDPRGRAVVGVRAFADDISATEWRVRMMLFVGQDFCTNDPSNPIPSEGISYNSNGSPQHPNCSTFNGDGTVNVNRADGQADVYELYPTGSGRNFGATITQTRCF